MSALQERGLLDVQQRLKTEPVPFRQSLDEYVESFHARSGFSRGRMAPEAVAEFDGAVRSVVSRYCPETVELQIVAQVAWGRPRRQEAGDKSQ